MKLAMDFSKIPGGGADVLRSMGASNVDALAQQAARAGASAPPRPPPGAAHAPVPGDAEALLHALGRGPAPSGGGGFRAADFPILSEADLATRAPPPPLSLTSKALLGLLGTAAVTGLGYGAYRGYQHLHGANENDEAPAELPKVASALVTPRDVARGPEAPPPSGARDAWSYYGF